ncbi:MAG TPA: peptide chain release factor N(5)-glutamine methyltransferase [Nitrospira sp.]|nr:peptide chain release factor N(5)-glutamine methyltransferase [Nitrospira sp.]MCE7976436.1 peptide chain release factor N(5)-glutamine methyltransferase [Nitrospira sp. NTP1]HQR15733.1 peptide chain release factor N(5)-glutamine methyltransferase [Nitrospira sp.]HQV10677.1 peptide chain release factor N(5)-glutamine methyltransferase [Nitrospira sp.]
MRQQQLADAVSSVSSLGALLKESESRLDAAGIDQPVLESAWVVEHVLKLSPLMQRVNVERLLTGAECERIQALIARRVAREPLQYLLGSQEFYGREFYVTPSVLIPRPESALLVDEAVRRCAQTPSAMLVDVGTGSGCLAVSLALALPTARVLAIDASADALLVARVNMAQHGVGSRISCFHGDLLTAIAQEGVANQMEVIVSNPPYISDGDIGTLQPEVRDFEPRLALAGGCDGMELHRRLLTQAPAYLKPGGALLMEVGLGQAAAVCRQAEEYGQFCTYAVLQDQGGIDRVVCFEKKAES